MSGQLHASSTQNASTPIPTCFRGFMPGLMCVIHTAVVTLSVSPTCYGTGSSP
jgi:hypothetical protein